MASAVTTLSRRLRILLASCTPNELEKYLSDLDEFTGNLTEHDATLHAFEKELHSAHDALVADAAQIEIFVAVLHRLIHALSSTSIIMSWWDLCLRPALREPKHSVVTVRRARELVLAALHNPSTQYSKLVSKFRQQLMELYLLDALNEGSGEDILAWAERDQKDRAVIKSWKDNLEAILIKHGCEHPADLLDEVNDHFLSEPERRLQLLTLMNTFISGTSFPSESAPLIAEHPIIMTLLMSLQLDGSSTACTMGLTIFIKLMPVFAIAALDKLKKILPRLLAILARIVCWRGRGYSTNFEGDELTKPDVSPVERQRLYPIREDLFWKRLELSFDMTASPAPSAKRFFTFLYFLFPCNTIRFLRQPIQYLASHDVPSPYTIGWLEVLDEDNIKSKSEPLLRRHVVHPHIIWVDAEAELASSGNWADYDVSQIVGECTLLDVRNAGIALQNRIGDVMSHPEPLSAEEATMTPRIYATELPPSPDRKPILLQDILSTSVLLKSGRDIDMTRKEKILPRPILVRSASSGATTSPSFMVSPTSPRIDETSVPHHITQAIAELQREILLLRNELNLELWLNRENVKHVGRLHEERVLSRSAEAERQALHNRLREYKNAVARLQDKFAGRETEATLMKSKIMEWNADIQKKYEALRAQRGQWDKQTASLRSDNVDLKAKLEAQGKLLAAATDEVFVLKTKIKETGHKIERLRDYESQIAQLTATQKLWSQDAQKYRDQQVEYDILLSNFKKMQLRLESYEKTQVEVVEKNRIAREELRSLETQLIASKREKPRHDFSAEIATAQKQQKALSNDNTRLRNENEELHRQIRQLQITLDKAGAPSGWSR